MMKIDCKKDILIIMNKLICYRVNPFFNSLTRLSTGECSILCNKIICIINIDQGFFIFIGNISFIICFNYYTFVNYYSEKQRI